MSRSGSPIAGWIARPFATRTRDLEAEVDIAAPARSTDALLMACLEDATGRAPDLAQVREWTVAERLDALLAIRRTGAAAAERMALTCRDTDCAAQFEAEIDLDAIRPHRFESEVTAACGERLVALRVPTGEDHARWQAERCEVAEIAASLLPAGEGLDGLPLGPIDAALAHADPLRSLELDVDCPVCGLSGHHTLNLEPHLLRAFANAQREWLGDIAAVATAFHWHERDIAALPSWRRIFYLGQARALQEGRAP